MRVILAAMLLSITPTTSAAEPPKIVVSKETTFITEPLGDDGLPDYRRAWLKWMRVHKVPAELNGAVLFWQTVGLSEIEQEYRQAFCDELGMPMPPADGRLEMVSDEKVINSLVIEEMQKEGIEVNESNLGSYEEANPNLVLSKQMRAYDYVTPYQACNSDVTKSPSVREWLNRNNPLLDQIVNATGKPAWYDPAPGLCASTKGDPCALGLRPLAIRSVANSLGVRAKFAIASGDNRAACRDIVAIHRLGEVCCRETYVDSLVAIAAKVLVSKPCELLLIEQEDAPLEILELLQQRHCLSPPLSQVPALLAGGERLFGVNYSIELLKANPKAFDLLHIESVLGNKDRTPEIVALVAEPIDCNRFLKGLNLYYDAIGAIAEKKTVSNFSNELQTWTKKNVTKRLDQPPASLKNTSPQQRADILLHALLAMEITGAEMFRTAEATHATSDQHMHLAYALARYRNDHDSYPQALSELTPNYVEKLPLDAFCNKEFGYRRTRNGFLLYSYGMNGVDDRGSCNDMNILFGYPTGTNDNQLRKLLGDEVPGKGILRGYIPVRSDDIAVRIPLLSVEFP